MHIYIKNINTKLKLKSFRSLITFFLQILEVCIAFIYKVSRNKNSERQVHEANQFLSLNETSSSIKSMVISLDTVY